MIRALINELVTDRSPVRYLVTAWRFSPAGQGWAEAVGALLERVPGR